jgi:ubiquinone/menaquinone biosynthesis C-methylase UbiE
MDDLKATGERLVTSMHSMHGVTEHLHRYAMAMELAKDKVVLDVASGEGYGAYLLSKYAKKVIGVELDADAVAHALNKYANQCDNLEFLQSSATNLPLPDNSIDVVTSFETLEHLREQDEMIREISRVLKEEGCLLISTPEKSIYKQRDPINPFHLRELTLEEFKSLLSKYFKETIYFKQRFVFGSLIHAENVQSGFDIYQGDYTSINNEAEPDDFYNKPFFNLALCSSSSMELKNINAHSIFSGLEVLRKEINDYKNLLENERKGREFLLNTPSFKVGYWIVSKFQFLKKFTRKKN